jgi:hypothetical protein
MQIQDWVAIGLGWLIAGPLFVVAFKALGLRYEARPSLPIGPRIRARKNMRRHTPVHARTGTARPVSAARVPEPTGQPKVPATSTYHIWWDDGLGPVPRSAPERAAGD